MQKPQYRHELKYLVSAAQTEILKARISGMLSPDLHAGITGRYNISSLYFDDYDNRCFYENENGTDPREKFRIRIYNHEAGHIALELKRKERGKVLKSSVLLTPEQAQHLVSGQLPPEIPEESALLRKLTTQMRTHLLHPTIIVEYDRYPFVYKNGNVRITFDTNVSSAVQTDDFLRGGYPKRPLMPTGLQLMEVKFDQYLPDFIYRALNLDSLQQTAYSKYYLCRKYSLR